MAETVIGVFEDHNHAEQAIHDLKQAGFRDDQGGFVVRHRGEEKMETREGRGVVAGRIISGLPGAGRGGFTTYFGTAARSTWGRNRGPRGRMAYGEGAGAQEKKTYRQ